jgi:hypothetical protein
MPVVKRIAALASLLTVAVPAAIAAAPTAGAADRVARADGSSFTGDVSRLPGHGELAVIGSDRRLYLLGGMANGVEKVVLDDPASSPRWSHDNRWLAVTTQPAPPESNPSADEPTTVWLVSRAGDVVRRLTPTDADVYHAAAAWSPRSNKIAIEYTAGVGTAPTQRLDVVDTAGNATSLASVAKRSGFAWSRDGRRIAVGLNRFDSSAGKWNSRVVTMAADGTKRHTVATDVGHILDVAGWWPDGSAVLVWPTSEAVAADGGPLVSMSIKTGHRRQLAKKMLQYPAWIATSRLRNKVALIAGGNRVPTAGHKHLVICTRTHCHRVAQGDKRVTFDPAWSVDGQLAAVRDHAIPPVDGDYSLSFTTKVDASGGVHLLRKGRLKALGGGEQATAPVWGLLGAMVFERDSSLWLLRPESSHPHRIAGPIDATDSFYGFVNWWDSFAWSHAVADDRPAGVAQVL